MTRVLLVILTNSGMNIFQSSIFKIMCSHEVCLIVLFDKMEEQRDVLIVNGLPVDVCVFLCMCVFVSSI